MALQLALDRFRDCGKRVRLPSEIRYTLSSHDWHPEHWLSGLVSLKHSILHSFVIVLAHVSKPRVSRQCVPQACREGGQVVFWVADVR